MKHWRRKGSRSTAPERTLTAEDIGGGVVIITVVPPSTQFPQAQWFRNIDGGGFVELLSSPTDGDFNTNSDDIEGLSPATIVYKWTQPGQPDVIAPAINI